MSIPAYQQKVTRSAYVTSFRIFYNAVCGCCTALPKRKRQWLSNPIMSKMEYISQIVFYLAKGNISGPNAAEIVTEKIDTAFEYLKNLEKPFISLWSHKQFSDKKMQSWIDMMMHFARDLNLRYPDYKKREPIIDEFFSIPDINKYDKAKFIDKMYQIHNQAITYVTNTSGRYTDPTQMSVVKLANEALYTLISGNNIWAQGLENYEKRRAKFIRGLDLVKALGADVVTHGKFHGFSPASLTKWCKSINEEVSLLNGLLQSELKIIQSLQDEGNNNVKTKSQ